MNTENRREFTLNTALWLAVLLLPTHPFPVAVQRTLANRGEKVNPLHQIFWCESKVSLEILSELVFRKPRLFDNEFHE